VLKLLACLFMLLDHIGFYFYDVLPPIPAMLLRTVGRLAFPIFAWYIARGFGRTRSLFKYFLRMGAFAVVSEVIIRFANNLAGYHLPGTNVLVTFSLAIVMLAGYQMARYSWRDLVAGLRPVAAADGTLPVKPVSRFNVRVNIGGIELDPRIGVPLGIVMILLSIIAAHWLKPDYGVYGLLTGLFFHLAIDRQDETDCERRIWLWLVPLNIVYMIYRIITDPGITAWAVVQLFSLLSIPLCLKHIKEKRPPAWARYGFYVFYPIHILLLVLLHRLMTGV
jgi:hypothetical protein